ncbi:M35 family metallo-endopeptidase [uncultured Thiodictyon sp.]|jgi:hypothetical protein|uniref:M35 family metallo-endopeptidase n=1 Tax=uncultured Thiodictyon sp. TaxID=1846217 RepID=UPI002600F5C2|nr:M35 family metallo-endopeptidase [uncultured Thiodictyon sp.]
MDWTIKFKWQYDYARTQFKDPKLFDASWQDTVKALYKLMSTKGFDAGRADILTQFRRQLDEGTTPGMHLHLSADKSILQAVNAWTDKPIAAVAVDQKMRASALKFLMHIYLLHTSGARHVWIHSLPKAFLHWPSVHLNSWASTGAEVKKLLKSKSEQFSESRKKHLAESAQYSLAWCHKANMVLAAAGSKSDKGKAAALTIVKRWFCDPGTTDAQLTKFINKLAKGFKDITGTLNKGSLILTDWVPLRNASTDEEAGFLNSEAFTFGSHGEGLDVVYIERSFFVNHAGNVLRGRKNWTRVLVHELTHLVCGTEDVKNGQTRYAWYGIGPHAGFPGSDAVKNADSWAFFCADCAGVLTDAERKSALKII